MTRPTTPLVLAARAWTALVTVGCLGCSAFDPVLDSLFGSSRASGMACASEMNATPGNQSEASASSVSEAASHVGHSCDCGSCYSATPHSMTFAVAMATVPGPQPHEVAQLLSVTRAPVAPPPESQTL